MEKLQNFVSKSIITEAKNFDWSYCFYTEDLMSAECACVVINVENVNQLKEIFRGAKYKSDGSFHTEGWNSIVKDLSKDFDRDYHYAIISFDSRGMIEVNMSDHDEIEMTIEDATDVQEFEDQFTLEAFDSYVQNTLNTSSIKGSYLKF